MPEKDGGRGGGIVVWLFGCLVDGVSVGSCSGKDELGFYLLLFILGN